MNATKVISTIALLSMTLCGCTLASFQRLRKPSQAQAPAAISFPEAEAALPRASIQYEPLGRRLRTFAASESWEPVQDPPGRVAYFDIYYKEHPEKLGAKLAPGAKDEGGDVCFRYPCSLRQQQYGSGFDAGVIECNDAMATKVTCSSVEQLPDGVKF